MKNVLKKSLAIAVSVTAVIALAFSVGVLYNNEEKLPESADKTIKLSRTGTQKQISCAEDMLECALDSVVGIASAQPFYNEKQQLQHMGSGVIVSEDGYIITNHHVIGSPSWKTEITLSDGKTVEGQTVWSDAALDLAIVKIPGDGYVYSEMGDAKALRVGERVLAIGNPLSMQFERTVTAGIVSAVGRSIEIENENGGYYYMEDLIQTDASINPGNSGGPLLDEMGNVVGINTVKVSSAEGMGFAVPVNVCVPIVEKLRLKGNFSTPYLGLYAYTPAAARYFGNKDVKEEGLFVMKLDPDGPAAKAGIKYADTIKEINGKPVSTMLELREELYKSESGDKVTIKYMRGKKEKTLRLTLSAVM